MSSLDYKLVMKLPSLTLEEKALLLYIDQAPDFSFRRAAHRGGDKIGSIRRVAHNLANKGIIERWSERGEDGRIDWLVSIKIDNRWMKKQITRDYQAGWFYLLHDQHTKFTKFCMNTTWDFKVQDDEAGDSMLVIFTLQIERIRDFYSRVTSDYGIWHVGNNWYVLTQEQAESIAELARKRAL